MSKKIQTLFIFILFAVIVILIKMTTDPLYDEDEANIARGEVYTLNDGWTIDLDNGDTLKNVSFPFNIETRMGNTVEMTHDISSDYASLSLNFFAENCALRIFVDGKPIYEAGFSDTGEAPDVGKMSEEVNELLKESDSTSEKVPAEEITADLPSNLSDGTIRIVLEKVNANQGIFIHKAIVAKRDVAVINILKDSMIPILCGVLIIIFSVIMISLDIMRFVSGERMRGLFILALMGIDIVIFIILQTDLMKIFFANRYYFEKMQVMTVVVIPIMFSLFYYLGFYIHFPKTTNLMIGINIVLTFTILILEVCSTDASLLLVKPITIVLLVLELFFVLTILIRWNKTSEGYKVISFDIVSVICLGTAAVLIVQGNLSEHEDMRKIGIDILLMAGFLFITLQHISIVIANFKANVEMNNKVLANQVNLAEEARAEAIAASEAKGNFLANMSHEIRTPINAVLGMDEMILRESREKSIREYAMDIHTAGQSLLSIINDILDMSKIESGKMEIIPVEYDLSSLIHDLSNMISFRAKAKNLTLEVTVDENLPARVLGDDVRIKQVVTNILTNAVKYTETGTIWMRVSGNREGNIENITFEIEDTGIGIKEEDMSKLFEAFQRIEEGRNRNIEGTGLGMSITMQLLQMMGSKLNVDSVYGKGSKFYFTIAQEIVDATPMGDFDTRIKELDNQYTYSRAFIAPNAKILVVDDNVMNRKVFSALLKPTQINIEEAESGYEAVDLCGVNRYDIIFMDHMMPEMDGVEAAGRIRSMEGGRDAVIIALTANATGNAERKFKDAGFDGFLPKPVNPVKLEDILRCFLRPELIETMT